MTLLSRLGYSPEKSRTPLLPDTRISVDQISIVIPVKNNQKGIDCFLQELDLNTGIDKCPREVVIVDNNSDIPVVVVGSYAFPVLVVECSIPGPAAARNAGVRAASGVWMLFLDSDCIPTESTVSGYAIDHTNHVGFAGNIQSANLGILAEYYDSQEILIAPEAIDEDCMRPDYLVTANCLIHKGAFDRVGGFDESFSRAGGEDIDIAFRLLEIGTLDYQLASYVKHEFSTNLYSFAERFYRYGLGNRHLSKKFGLRLTPLPFFPQKITAINCLLAILQYTFMSIGFFSRDKKVHVVHRAVA